MERPMTAFDSTHPFVLAFKDWDAIRPTSKCLYVAGLLGIPKQWNRDGVVIEPPIGCGSLA